MESMDTVAKIITPCIRKCRIENNICTGCGRSLSQIKNWIDYSHETRVQIMKELYERQRK